MTTQTFFVGLDFILTDDLKIKVLEMQNLFECDLALTEGLVGKNPQARLLRAMQVAEPSLMLDVPYQAGDVVKKAQAASLKGADNTIPNRGIEAMLRAKFLFYLFCNSTPALMNYIPVTDVLTVDTLSSARLFSASCLVLFKPASGSHGRGILKLPEGVSGMAAREEIIKKQHIAYLQASHYSLEESDAYPFVLQEYLYEGAAAHPLSKPVMRLYAAIRISDDGNIDIAIDWETATKHQRIIQNETDYSLENNRHSACDFDASRRDVVHAEVQSFLLTFFKKLLKKTTYPTTKNLITYKCWESLSKDYLKNGESTEPLKRLKLLSLISLSLCLESFFTIKKLSEYQYGLFIAFLRQFYKQDNLLGEKTLNWLTEAVIVMISNKLKPYVHDVADKLREIVFEYRQVLAAYPESARRNLLRDQFDQFCREEELLQLPVIPPSTIIPASLS